MGLFDMFKGRRSRESAISPEQAASVQQPQDVEPVGQMFPTEASSQGSSGGELDLGALFGMIGESLKSGNPQVVIGDAQAIQAQGTEMGDELREVMRRHGISESMDPNQPPNVTDPAAMQREIMEVLARKGLGFGAGAESSSPLTED